MTNTNQNLPNGGAWDWSQVKYFTNSSSNFTVTYSGISSNNSASSGVNGKYSIWLFRDNNNNGWFDGGQSGDTQLGFIDMAIDGVSIYETNFNLYGVSGTLTLPADTNSVNYWVLLDSDVNGGNGYVSYSSGTIGSTPTNKVNYFIPFRDPGTFYIYAGVDANNDGDPSGPTTGDFYGHYGGTPTPLDAPGSPNAVIVTNGPNIFDFNLAVKP